MAVLPPGVDLTGNDRLDVGKHSCPAWPETVPIPLLAWNRATESAKDGCGVLAQGKRWLHAWLALTPAPDALHPRTMQSVRERISTRSGDQVSVSHLILTMNAPLWTRDPRAWDALKAVLRPIPEITIVAYGQTETVRGEVDDGIRRITVPLAGPVESPGILWFSHRGHVLQASLIDSAGVSEVRPFNREVQQDRSRLVRSLAATPVCDEDRTTRVRFQNTTPHVLNWNAEWQFEGQPVPVQPEILSFELAQGEGFEQEFRFSPASDSVLKFRRPRFVLSAELPDGTDDPSPLRMVAEPWCCMQGTAAQTDAEVQLDGDPSEWAGRGYPLNDRTQVVRGLAEWGGPGDLSGNLFVSRTADAILLGGQVYDDEIQSGTGGNAALEVALVLAPAPADGAPDNTGTAPPQETLRLHLRPQGHVRLLRPAPQVRLAGRQAEDEMSFEAVIPFSLFPGGRPANPCLVDAVLTESKPGNERIALVFSSPDPALRDVSLYGRFWFAGNGEEK